MPPRSSKNLVAALLALAPLPALAGPNGGTVVGGNATIQGQGSSSVTINQSSENTIINWNTFNIGTGEVTTFNQPNSSAIALNRVTGGLGPSEILGTLTANGRVFIVNGDGIIFGRGSTVNTAGFLATTSDIRNGDFMAGHYNFNIPGKPNASIINYGNITAANGGFAALVAPGVRNAGTITATLGTVALAAGNAYTLDFYGDKLITLAVNDQIASTVVDVSTGQPLAALVSNSGKLKANGGTVQLTAAAARAVVESVINNTGVIEANSIGTHNGKIVLGAATGSTKPPGAPVQTVKLSGKISAAGKNAGTTGGTIVVTGENIQLNNAQINASGQAGGGTVLIGGDTGGGHPSAAAFAAGATLAPFTVPTATTVSVDAGSTINASATGSGNGGKVVLWSDQLTTFAGTILAQGGANGGNGGFVETSSHGVLDFTGNVSTLAPNGKNGTLLLDPYNLEICQMDCSENTNISGGNITPTNSPSFIAATTIEYLLSSGNVTLTTGGDSGSGSGNITLGNGVHLIWNSGNTLTLSAFDNIILNPNSVIANTGSGNLVLRADNTGTGNGNIQIFTTALVDWSRAMWAERSAARLPTSPSRWATADA